MVLLRFIKFSTKHLQPTMLALLPVLACFSSLRKINQAIQCSPYILGACLCFFFLIATHLDGIYSPSQVLSSSWSLSWFLKPSIVFLLWILIAFYLPNGTNSTFVLYLFLTCLGPCSNVTENFLRTRAFDSLQNLA